MKTITKDFDCIEMKNAIQARLIARRKGMKAAEVMADIEQTLNRSSEPIADLWRRLNTARQPIMKAPVVAGRR